MAHGCQLEDYHECPSCFCRRSLDSFRGKDQVCMYCRRDDVELPGGLSDALLAAHTDISPTDQIISAGHQAGMMVAIRRAHFEGRLDPSWARELHLDTGEHLCQYCGMRHWTEDESFDCCRPWFQGIESRGGL